MLTWLQRNRYMIFGFAVAAAISGFGVNSLLGGGPSGPLVINEGSSLPDGAPIRLQIKGGVVHPGVYEAHSGDRVVDVLALAGGPSDAADLDALNLARRVRDEEKLVVPTRANQVAGARLEAMAPGAKINVNTATAAQLDQLPGIGEAYSRRIVDSRTVDGPFNSLDQLVERRVLPRATYEAIRDLITLGP